MVIAKEAPLPALWGEWITEHHCGATMPTGELPLTIFMRSCLKDLQSKGRIAPCATQRGPTAANDPTTEEGPMGHATGANGS